jgi:phosphoserine phosphatase RsbU/P
VGDPRLPHFEHPDLEVRSFLAAPMRFRNKLLGVMAVVNPVNRVPFTRENQENLQVLADQASLSVFYATLQESLEGKRRLDQEMQVAQRIQDSLQARDVPDVPGLEITTFTDAAMEVGGDYVDVFRVDADRIGLVVGDVSGKGIGGALFMAILRTMMRAKAVGVTRPSDALRQVNRMLLEDMRHERFVTLVYMVLDHKRRELRVTRAGHDPLLLRKGSSAVFTELGTEGPGLGLLDAEAYDAVVPEDVIPLDPGDVVVAFTDGVVEAPDESGEEWGHARFQAALTAAAAQPVPLRQALDEVKDALLRFVGNMAQYDDVTLLGVRVVDPTQSATQGAAHHA